MIITADLITELDRLNAKRDAGDAPMPPCPEWCRLRPGHGWDSVHDDGHQSRGHGGPTFGVHVSIGSREHQDGRVDGFGIRHRAGDD